AVRLSAHAGGIGLSCPVNADAGHVIGLVRIDESPTLFETTAIAASHLPHPAGIRVSIRMFQPARGL
ncbi:hypothetical protein, partial [Escherichia coli]|uniref:hypothetical protein n=1 Tax=Escherichia coli TaxID=562 RepID=UPI0019D6E858